MGHVIYMQCHIYILFIDMYPFSPFSKAQIHWLFTIHHSHSIQIPNLKVQLNKIQIKHCMSAHLWNNNQLEYSIRDTAAMFWYGKMKSHLRFKFIFQKKKIEEKKTSNWWGGYFSKWVCPSVYHFNFQPYAHTSFYAYCKLQTAYTIWTMTTTISPISNYGMEHASIER